MKGLFVTIEGPDGAGKSTQAAMLAAALADRDPLVVREPGGTELGEAVRDLLLHRAGMSGLAEMYLFMAARAELLETRIKPALAAGRLVIDDRYHDSTRAYQGGARGIAVDWPQHFPRPDLTILLAIPAAAGIERHEASGKPLDRLDAESIAFHEAVARSYDRLAEAEPDRFLRVDGRADPAAIHGRVMERVRQLL